MEIKVNMNPKLLFLIGLGLVSSNVYGNELQAKLMDIAAQEAKIANIGANKYMMLYGTNNPIPIINRWNDLEKHPKLSQDQIDQINQLEKLKKQILEEHTQVEH